MISNTIQMLATDADLSSTTKDQSQFQPFLLFINYFAHSATLHFCVNWFLLVKRKLSLLQSIHKNSWTWSIKFYKIWAGSYRFLEPNFPDTIHEFLHLLRIICSGAHKRSPNLIQRNFKNYGPPRFRGGESSSCKQRKQQFKKQD